MSVSLSNAFVTLFDAEVKQAYQGKAMLVGAVRARRGVEGSTVKFPKVGSGVATPRIPQTDVPQASRADRGEAWCIDNRIEVVINANANRNAYARRIRVENRSAKNEPLESGICAEV